MPRIVAVVAACLWSVAVVVAAEGREAEARPYQGKVFLGLVTRSVPLAPDERYASKFGLEVLTVAAESAGEKAGIRVGDVIVSVDDSVWTTERIELGPSFGKAGEKNRPGDTARFRLLRADPAAADGPRQLIEADVVLTPYPGTAPEQPRTPANDDIRPDLKDVQPDYAALCRRLTDALGFADQTRDLLARLARSEEFPDPYRLPIVRYVHRDPFKIEAVSREIARPLLARETLAAGDIPLLIERAEHVLLRFDATSRAGAAPKPPTLPDFAGKDLAAHLDYVEAVLRLAAEAHGRAFAAFTVEEVQLIRDHRNGLLDSFISHHMLSYDKDRERQGKSVHILRLARKVVLSALFEQARLAAMLAMPEFTASLRAAAEAAGKPLDQQVIAERATPFGPILVAGTGRTRYEKDYAALYDLGGDDVYANNAGSPVWGAIPTAVLVDYAGNDAYESTAAFRQGCGDMGAGILVDMQGDDCYVARRFSQGTGFLGIGTLVDEAGDDTYRSLDTSQAVGHWGAGLLLDSRGRDRYEAHDASQAVGFCGGFGLLVDAGPEGDSYYCKGNRPSGYGTSGVFEGWGQACGTGYRPYASGGVAVLLDRGGPDRFEAGNFSQGGGYFYGFGLLYNAGKDADTYIGSHYAQGFGCHQAAGAFIEEGGDDAYLTRYGVAQGLSWDEAVSLFLDEAGDDRYEGGSFSHGASAHNGFALFIDRQGRDTYLYTDQARAGGNKYHGGWSLSLFLDLGGQEDSYPSRKNNLVQAKSENSIFCDLPAGIEQALKDEAWRQLAAPVEPKPAK